MIEDRPKLKEQMQYCMDHPEELSRLSKVKVQVSEVKGIMLDNIDKVKLLTNRIELARFPPWMDGWMDG